MQNKKELSPEIKAQIDEKAREFREKKENREIINEEELRTVTGGAGVNPNDVINGWTYTDLHDLLCWVYESYHIPSEKHDYAKGLTIDVANSYIPSILWEYYSDNKYPDFIELPMIQIWSGIGL